MKGLDELKEEIKNEASENPEKFFATDVLREKGFSRGQCKECGLYFWSSDESREICGEPECGDGYTFINDSPTREEYTHTESWEVLEKFMHDRGYTSIDRYPVVARWRDDVEFTGASIYCFQPYVVSGEASPPADELIIPQPSLRFNDVDNVGITGRHYANFTMIGQTCFKKSDEYDQDRYFRDMFEFTVEELGIPEEKLILHEDSWGGGGNLGACMEFFVDGLELFNQVYMFYKQTPDGYEELDLKVLDMGMGHERITWISRGTETSYESVMPETIEKMKKRTGLEIDQEVWEKFLPHSSELNIDEVDDIDEKWEEVAEKIGLSSKELKNEIKPAAALYSIAEHSRALNFALADGKIPSNTGGGYNLRMIYRRAKDFIEKYEWDINMKEVARWNAEELEEMYPELLDSIDEIQEILEVEARKYKASREKAREKLEKFDEQPSIEKMIELYESHGVSPEMMEEHGFDVPEDFYTMLGEDEEAVKSVEEEFDLENIPDTELSYYDEREPYRKDGEVTDFSFEASVENIVDDEWIVLDRTKFYPQGGGQAYDTGEINEFDIEEVQKQGNVVLHRVPRHELNEGDSVSCSVNGERRKQLTQHHSVTHMVNAAAREILGEHIYQAGANKTTEKARLDITHYEKISEEDEYDEEKQEKIPSQKTRIENLVKEIIDGEYEINVLNMNKSEAEQEYGFRIYQGGAPPGNNIRLIEIEDIEEIDHKEIEACGGTHLTNTGDAEDFYITDVKRIQDGVIRLEYAAGKAAKEYEEYIEGVLEDAMNNLFPESNGFIITKDDSNSPRDMEKLNSSEEVEFKDKRDKLNTISEKYDVEVEDLPKTINRFMGERKQYENETQELAEKLDDNSRFIDRGSLKGAFVERAKQLYEQRNDYRGQKEALTSKHQEKIKQHIENKASEGRVNEEVETDNIGLLIQLAKQYSSQYNTTVTLFGEEGAVSASEEGLAIEELKQLDSENVQGDENFAKAFDI